MKQKHWQVSVFDKTSKTIKDDTFYTTDTEAYLIFELIDEDFTPDTATVTVYNVNGKATINVNVDVSGGIVRYEIPEEAIGHGGVWRTQVIFSKGGEDYTTGIINFDVSGHLLDNTKQKLVAITNWNRFIKHAEELIDDWEQLEEIRQANERQRELAEKKRHNEFKKNETSRQENELVREEGENNRQSTFEANETERQTEFETNETERESTFNINESTRQDNYEQAEATRKSAEVIRLANEVDRVNAENIRAGFYGSFENELEKKADKQQEVWQTLTLLNGITGSIRIMKDSFGFVHLEGDVLKDVWTSGLSITNLPSGYKPEMTKLFFFSCKLWFNSCKNIFNCDFRKRFKLWYGRSAWIYQYRV